MTGHEAAVAAAEEATARARADGQTRRVTCRYLRLSGHQCTGEAVDPLGDVRLCQKHLGRALALVQQRIQGGQ